MPTRRSGGVLVDEGGGSPGADLLREWEAFVGAGSPLMNQRPPPPSLSSPTLTRVSSASSPGLAASPSFTAVQSVFLDRSPSPSPPPSPTRSIADSTYSSHSSRDIFTTLPRTTTLLDARRRESYDLPSSPSIQLHTEEVSSSMSRVDSEVLLTRMALRRLGSTGFEGDALDRLGRGGSFADAEEEGEAWEEEETEDDGLVSSFSDRYRDSYTEWKRSPSSTSVESTPSSSSSRSSRSSRSGGSVRA